MKITWVTIQPDVFWSNFTASVLGSAEGVERNIVATFEDGSTERILSYYPDEISFTETELVGLTKDEALRLFREKDLAYLRS